MSKTTITSIPMTTNSALLDKSKCLQCLGEIKGYLMKDQSTIEASIDVLCDVSDLINWIECCVLNWEELSRLYQQAECLLLQSNVFFSDNDMERTIVEKYIEAFREARAAAREYIKTTFLGKEDRVVLLKLGFPRERQQGNANQH